MNAKKIDIPKPAAAQVLGAAPATSERPEAPAKKVRLTADMPTGMHLLVSRVKESLVREGSPHRTTKAVVFAAFANWAPTAAAVETLTREAMAEHPDISDPHEALIKKYPEVAEYLAEFGDGDE